MLAQAARYASNFPSSSGYFPSSSSSSYSTDRYSPDRSSVSSWRDPYSSEAYSPCNYSTTSSSATTPQMVAIDSKIEQAMDLVKTHLMFAVREEVEVLRARIVDLEHHVVHLETENSVLRDHIPQDVLQKLSSH